MKNRVIPGILLIFLTLSLSLGAYLAYIYDDLEIKKADSIEVGQNPAVDVIEADDGVIYEQQFNKCGHIITAPFADRVALTGKTVEELKKQYTMKNGYQLVYQDNILSIKHKIEDWCSLDQEKCRLKEYQGRIAVYQGPNGQEDVLMRVTEIKMDSLPGEIREAIEKGEYEFADMERLNDALENLDEYQ